MTVKEYKTNMSKREKQQIMITKRDGKTEPLQIDKILYRIEKECYGLDLKWVEPFEVAKKVIDGIYDGVSSRQLDTLAMETAASLTTKHPDYSTLAARIAITSMHKDTERTFSKSVKKMYDYVNPATGLHNPLVSREFYDIVTENQAELDSAIVKSRDFIFDYFGYKTMEKSYLLKIDGKIAERPQYMFMRMAIGIHGKDIESAIKTYELVSEGYFTHATPTLFNAGRDNGQLASCFLLTTEDSIEGIMDTLKDAALISKAAGGLGIDFARVRGAKSYIAGTNGYSNGIIPFLKMYNEMTRAVDQCFIGETLIETNNGKVKIENIKEGDLVLTSNKIYNKVLHKKEYIKNEFVIIKTNNRTIQVTPDHQILVLKNSNSIEKDNIIKGLKSGMFSLDWINAGELTINDKVVNYNLTALELNKETVMEETI